MKLPNINLQKESTKTESNAFYRVHNDVIYRILPGFPTSQGTRQFIKISILFITL